MRPNPTRVATSLFPSPSRRRLWFAEVLAVALCASLAYAVDAHPGARASGPAPSTARTADDLALVAGTARTRTLKTNARRWVGAYSIGQGRVARRLVYRMTTTISAPRRGVVAHVQLRQVRAGRVVASRTVHAGAPRRARAIRLALVGQLGVSRVQVRIKTTGPRGAALRVGRVYMRRATYAPVARPCVRNALGIPTSGAYAGSTVSGTSFLPHRESYYGRTLPIRRTYWGPSQVNSAVNSVRGDLARKRLPWISFKLPGSWKSMADGAHDAWVLDLVRKLNAVPGPVWIAFHHEPENDGQDVRQWTRMQGRLARMVKANSDNIATTMIVMGWHQIGGTNPALKLQALWPGDGLIDIIGMDPYNWYGTRRSDGVVENRMPNYRTWFRYFNNFARAHHTRWGVAEIGYTDTAARRSPTWIASTYNQLVAERGVAMSYFDTSYNTLGYTWALDLVTKRSQWARAIRVSVRLC